MNHLQIKPYIGIPIFILTLLLCSEAFAQTQQLINKGIERLSDNQAAQENVDKVYALQRDVSKQFVEQAKLLNGLNMYNKLLAGQLEDQDNEISTLNHSINNATLIERQIMPLLVRMVDALENFVEVDMPFLQDERKRRVEKLKHLLTQAEFTTSEKTRRVFEAYQIENEFGYTIESYKGEVELDSGKFAVEFLRIGRLSLMYRDLTGERVGHWDKQLAQWKSLTEQQYLRHIGKGLRIAKEEISPELITIPLFAKMEGRK